MKQALGGSCNSGINSGRDYFLRDLAASDRTLAHLAFCAIAILRLPAADIFRRGVVLVDPDFVVREPELAPMLSSRAMACSSFLTSALSSATILDVFMAKRISARLTRCRPNHESTGESVLTFPLTRR